MSKIFSSFISLFQRIRTSKIAMGAIGVVLIGAGSFSFLHKSSPSQFVTVQRGSIAESISLTGNTTPTETVSLSFGSSGIISHTYTTLGAQVYAGQVLAELNITDLAAGLRQAQAAADQQKAKLRGLQNSAQPTDASSAFITALRSSYLQTESTVLRYADTLFMNGISVNPTISIRTQNRNEEQSINMERLVVGEKLKKWKDALTNLNASSDSSTLQNAGVIGTDTIISVASFLDHLGTITGNLSPDNSGLSQDGIDADRTTVNTAAQTMSSAASAEQNASDAWNSAPQNIDAQEAAVAAAQASVDSARAKIQNARIIAPISGIVTQFDAKVGQLASPSAPLVSLIGNGGFEVDAGVSETDVGKLAVGNTVTMTLDAFSNETFSGKVFYIAPAQTNTQGVISYQIKITFSKPDPRLKSGLTANITIQTKQKNDVLILPQYAILQNDNGTFVETLVGKTVTTTPVTLGIQDQEGNVEILSGVTLGEQVINIGLKKTQ